MYRPVRQMNNFANGNKKVVHYYMLCKLCIYIYIYIHKYIYMYIYSLCVPVVTSREQSVPSLGGRSDMNVSTLLR